MAVSTCCSEVEKISPPLHVHVAKLVLGHLFRFSLRIREPCQPWSAPVRVAQEILHSFLNGSRKEVALYRGRAFWWLRRDDVNAHDTAIGSCPVNSDLTYCQYPSGSRVRDTEPYLRPRPRCISLVSLTRATNVARVRGGPDLPSLLQSDRF